MHNHATRLARIEQSMRPVDAPRFVRGLLDYDDSGKPKELALAGHVFTPALDEPEDAFVERAKRESGTEHLVLRQFVNADNGRPAPGFEWFASPV